VTLTPSTLALVVGILAFAARYVLTGAIENDHFVTFTRSLQVLYGDWPVRDFDDPGFPLSYLVSTAAAALFGPSLFVNVLLCVLLLALTSVLTCHLAFRATGNTAAALVAAVVTMAIHPRLYNATKVIVPVVAMWLAWRYADSPDRRRLVALALWSAVAFLLRHDYVVYVAAGYAVLIVMCHADAPRELAVRLVSYAALSLLFVAPWLLYVQLFEGVSEYFASALRFVAAEGRRTATGPQPALFYVLTAVPIVGLVVSFRRGPRLDRVHLAAASVMLLALDLVFLRDVLAARIPDVIAPTAVIAAAIAGHYLSQRAMNNAAMIGMIVIVAAITVQVARGSEPVSTLREPVGRIGQITRRLREVSGDIIPNPSTAPLITYLSRCTAPGDRVLVAGFGPEIPALAHRPFAARLPSWLPGYYEDPADVNRALARLRRERLGAAVFLDGSLVVVHSWPGLMEAIRGRGFDEHAVPSINTRIRVWLPRAANGTRHDSATDLPCLFG
jgi:4-amino-4-deoxy-L-arabinose transferase-like glycosyltransferase